MKLFSAFVVMAITGCLSSQTSLPNEWYEYPIAEPYVMKYNYYELLLKPNDVVEFCQYAIDLCWEWNLELAEKEKPTIDCRLPDNVILHSAKAVAKPQDSRIHVDDFDIRVRNTDCVMRTFCHNYGVNITFQHNKIMLFRDP